MLLIEKNVFWKLLTLYIFFKTVIQIFGIIKGHSLFTVSLKH